MITLVPLSTTLVTNTTLRKLLIGGEEEEEEQEEQEHEDDEEEEEEEGEESSSSFRSSQTSVLSVSPGKTCELILPLTVLTRLASPEAPALVELMTARTPKASVQRPWRIGRLKFRFFFF